MAAGLRRQAVEEALHGRDARLHLLDQLIEVLWRVVTEEVAVLLHEAIEVGLAAGHLLGEHPVEVVHHLLHARHVFWAHVGDLLLEVLEQAVHHGLLQHLHQFLVLGGRLRVHELVLLQALDLAAGVLWQVVQLLLLLLHDLLQHFGQALAFFGRGLLGSRCLGDRLLERLQRVLTFTELAPGLGELAVEGTRL